MGDAMRCLVLVVLTYSLWLVAAVIALGIMLWMRILVLIDLPMVVFRLNPWVLRAIDRFGTVGLGLIWLIFVVASEPYFRRLYERQMPAINILKVFIAEGLILGAAYGGHLLIFGWLGHLW